MCFAGAEEMRGGIPGKQDMAPSWTLSNSNQWPLGSPAELHHSVWWANYLRTTSSGKALWGVVWPAYVLSEGLQQY